MRSVPHEFVSVDMRGLKGPLLARARAERMSVSALVRDAVAARLNQGGTALAQGSADEVRFDEYAVRLIVRLFAREARQITGAEARLRRAELLRPQGKVRRHEGVGGQRLRRSRPE